MYLLINVSNGTLGMASDNHLEIVSALYSESRNSKTSTEVACRTALGKLHNSIQYWPTPATGICLSLHDFEGQVRKIYILNAWNFLYSIDLSFTRSCSSFIGYLLYFGSSDLNFKSRTFCSKTQRSHYWIQFFLKDVSKTHP